MNEAAFPVFECSEKTSEKEMPRQLLPNLNVSHLARFPCRRHNVTINVPLTRYHELRQASLGFVLCLSTQLSLAKMFKKKVHAVHFHEHVCKKNLLFKQVITVNWEFKEENCRASLDDLRETTTRNIS